MPNGIPADQCESVTDWLTPYFVKYNDSSSTHSHNTVAHSSSKLALEMLAQIANKRQHKTTWERRVGVGRVGEKKSKDQSDTCGQGVVKRDVVIQDVAARKDVSVHNVIQSIINLDRIISH